MDGKTAAEGLSSLYERSSVKWPQATVASVQRLLKASGLKRIDALQRRDQNGCIPVLFAVIYGAKLEVVQFLCEENLGDSLAWEDSFQWDLLMHACQYNNHHLIPYLLAIYGIERSERKNRNGETVLTLAKRIGSRECADLLSKENSCLRHTFNKGTEQREQCPWRKDL